MELLTQCCFRGVSILSTRLKLVRQNKQFFVNHVLGFIGADFKSITEDTIVLQVIPVEYERMRRRLKGHFLHKDYRRSERIHFLDKDRYNRWHFKCRIIFL